MSFRRTTNTKSQPLHALINTCMKIDEFMDPLKTYIVTVRVVLRSATSTVRTSIKAEGPSQAFILLSRLYGMGNVVSITEIVNESSRTCEIQAKTIFPEQTTQTLPPEQINDSVQASQANALAPKKRQVSARPIASPVKHELIRRRLTRQLMRQSNIVSPNADDLRVARSRAETALKRADLEHQKRVNQLLRHQSR